MQTGAQPDSEKASQAGESLPGDDSSAASPAAASGGQTPSNGTGKEPDPRFEATTKARIMIVDDEPIIVDILKNVLEDVGYRSFIETTESTRALDLLAENKPDVVLLDVNMPEVTRPDRGLGLRHQVARPRPGSHRCPRQAGRPERARASCAQHAHGKGSSGSTVELR
jgi:hypothetical protein